MTFKEVLLRDLKNTLVCMDRKLQRDGLTEQDKIDLNIEKMMCKMYIKVLEG